ncbi:MAG: hypothetical protein A2293_14105 [Elusimicrobia bacterium RIFOXYB2_FULL_49_7]|nr:MAG: hypothetical protein A2293_14105 [Elusimicrobia bacterium RIFOXYB2_FULL_49_7]
MGAYEDRPSKLGKSRENGTGGAREQNFEYIYQEVGRQQRAGQPVISVDTKKKELIGNFKNAGREQMRK